MVVRGTASAFASEVEADLVDESALRTSYLTQGRSPVPTVHESVTVLSLSNGVILRCFGRMHDVLV